MVFGKLALALVVGISTTGAVMSISSRYADENPWSKYEVFSYFPPIWPGMILGDNLSEMTGLTEWASTRRKKGAGEHEKKC